MTPFQPAFIRRFTAVATLTLLALGTATAPAATYYQNDIVLDGSYTDWDDVPVIATSGSTGSSIDFASLQVAHSTTHLFVRMTFHALTDPNFTNGGTYISIDSDNNLATGFNIYGLNAVGADTSWQNSTGFTQTSGNFNTGNGVTGGTVLQSPFFVPAGTLAQELSISLDAVSNLSAQPVFPSDAPFGLLIWNDDPAQLDFIGSVQYTLPEPGTMSLLAACGVLGLARRQR